MNPIAIQVSITATKDDAWTYYTQAEHITQWNFASADWHCPHATTDLRAGGRYLARMEARDGSQGFDFEAIYDEVVPGTSLPYDFARRWLVPQYVASGNFTQAQTTHGLLLNVTPEHQAENTYWGVVIDLGLAGKNEREADSVQVVTVEQIANGTTPTRHIARAFLYVHDERLLDDTWIPSTDSTIHYRMPELGPTPKPSEFDLELYPNPSTGQLTLALEADAAGPLALDWYDAQGRRLLTETYPLHAGRNQIEIDRSSWPAGLYLWRARRGGQHTQGKLMLHTN